MSGSSLTTAFLYSSGVDYYNFFKIFTKTIDKYKNICYNIDRKKKERFKPMMIKKLTAMPYAQAHIEIDDDNNTTLFSYVTRVATLTAEGWLTIHGLHSMTTRRHISAFCREYCGVIDYATAKSIYNDGYKINIHTGEVIELD